MNLISTKDIQPERLMDRQKRLTMYPFSIIIMYISAAPISVLFLTVTYIIRIMIPAGALRGGAMFITR